MKFKYKEKEFEIKKMGHATIMIEFENIKLAIDPYRLKTDFHDVDFIFITHEHFDHFSMDDIKKIKVESTTFIFPKSMKEKVKDIKNAILMDVNETKEVKYNGNKMRIKTIPAYNLNKRFHQKARDWVGFLINIDGIKFYYTGDSDFIDEMKDIQTDFLFLPVCGEYVMNVNEAINLCNEIKPEYAIPINYGEIMGILDNAIELKENYSKTLILKNEYF